MQGFERMDGELIDAAVGHLVPAGSMFAFLAAHRAEVFPDADHADLFALPGVGRPSLSVTRVAAVLTLQVLHDYSDRETAEAARFDVRWKATAGVPLDDPGFDQPGLMTTESAGRGTGSLKNVVTTVRALGAGAALAMGQGQSRSWRCIPPTADMPPELLVRECSRVACGDTVSAATRFRQ